MKIKFCNFSTDQIAALREIFSTIYEVSEFVELMDIYEVFKRDFPGTTFSTPQIIDRVKLKPKTNQSDLLSKYYDYDYQIGIDLPVLIQTDCNPKGTIFIVAEDPLRDFDNPSHGIRLATPFAVHMEEYRNKKLPVYWQVIDYILQQGYNVYVTDIHKLWVKRREKTKLKFRGDISNNFQLAFQKEKEAFEPELVITFGTPASFLINKMDLGLKAIAFPHPTRTANGAWKRLFNNFYNTNEVRCTDISKLTYIKVKLGSITHNKSILCI